MIAPTPPAANLHSQLMRVWVSEPSSLSNLPEMFDRKMRFLTVRLRNLSGVKMTSSVMTRPRSLAQQSPVATLRPMPHHELDLLAGRALARGFEFEDDESARAHRAAHGGTRPGGLAQHTRRRKQALFDDGIDRGWGAPSRLAPQPAHAFETAHEIVHGDTGGMNPGEIAMDEIGEQSTRSLQAAAEMEEDRSERVTGVDGGVERAGGCPTLRARLVVGGEQSPDRLLRGRAERLSAGHAANGADQTGDRFLVPQRRSSRRIEPAPQAVLSARALCVTAWCHRWQWHAVDLQHAADALHQNAINQRSARVEAPVEPGVIGEAADVRSHIGLNEIDQTGDAQRSAHRPPPSLVPREVHVADIGKMRPQLRHMPLQHRP